MQTDDQLKQSYLGVWNPKPLDTPVHGEHVRHMPIVEPEPACVHQHRPVVCVRRSKNAKIKTKDFLLCGWYLANS